MKTIGGTVITRTQKATFLQLLCLSRFKIKKSFILKRVVIVIIVVVCSVSAYVPSPLPPRRRPPRQRTVTDPDRCRRIGHRSRRHHDNEPDRIRIDTQVRTLISHHDIYDTDDDKIIDSFSESDAPSLLLLGSSSGNSSTKSWTRQQFIVSLAGGTSAFAVTATAATVTSSSVNDAAETDAGSGVVAGHDDVDECQSGRLVQESAIPGAYQSTCMNLPRRTVRLPLLERRLQHAAVGASTTTTTTTAAAAVVANTYRHSTSSDQMYNYRTSQSNAATIAVRQEPPGSGSTGMTVWNSGLVLTRLLDAIVDYQQSSSTGTTAVTTTTTATTQQLPLLPSSIVDKSWRFEDQDVLELGCGTGLVSIAAYKLGARSVVATDGNPQVLQLASSNVRWNTNIDHDDDHGQLQQLQQQRPAVIDVRPLQWGLLDAMDYAESASLVVGADLTYNAGSWRALAETIVTCLRPKNGYCIYLSLGHEGFNVDAEIDGFLQVAKSVGLTKTVNNMLAGSIDVSKLLDSVLLPTERNILTQSGGARVIVLQRTI